jgi:hypothetical protein
MRRNVPTPRWGMTIPDADYGFHVMSTYLPEGIREPSEAGGA